MKKAWATKPLREVLRETATINPLLLPDAEFDYIDVSSVSNTSFQIESTQRLKGSDAPSRARRVVRSHDVLFATIRPTLRRIAVVPEALDNQVCSTGYIVLRPVATLHHRFLFYWLFTDGFMSQMETLQKGTSYPAVSDGDVRAQLIPLPALPEQQRIVAILDEAFDSIASAKANAEKNLENSRELFESQREEALAARAGWEDRPLDDLCEIKHGFAFKSEFFTDAGDFVLLTPGNFFERGGYRDRGEKQKFYVGPVPAAFVLAEGDMLVAMTEQAAGLLGSPIVVPESGRFLHNQRLGLVVPRDAHAWATEFFFHVLNTRRVRREIHDGSTGQKVRHTSPSRIGAVRVAFPRSRTEQVRVAHVLTQLEEESQRLEGIYQQKLDALDELKKSLLHRAFSGAL